MKIAMVASEANPFSKSGGLGDVVYSLSKELVKKDNEVTIIVPFYRTGSYKNAEIKDLYDKDIQMNWRHNSVFYKSTVLDGITYIFVDRAYYFGRDAFYGFLDDAERFAFFTLSAFEYIKDNKFDVVHCHDWQAGMLPLVLKDKGLKKIRTIVTIHNPAFLGYFDKEQLYDFYNLDTKYFDDGTVRFNYRCSSLKAGITVANKITTVSPTHRNELLTPEGGNGLNDVLVFREKDFIGVVNGVDIGEFNPSKDKLIKAKFTKATVKEGKEANKKDLLKTFNLSYTDKPVFGIVTRLTWQKGTSLIFSNAKLILDRGAKLVVLGSGEREQELQLEDLRSRYPDQVGIYIGYSNEIAHKIYAGSDFFLMPSLFEPCGISQMISHRYATIPIVRETGGLADTVYGFTGDNLDKADGVRFSALDYGGISYGINKAFEIYENEDRLCAIRLNAMAVDHSWAKSCKKYLELYKK